jgi:hypothetical protein
MSITPNDLVFVTQNNEIISGGFKINSNFLKEQIQKGGGIEKDYVIPAGLLYHDVSNIQKDLTIKESNIIDNDLYNKLFDLVIYKKKNKTINNNKPNKNKKTNKKR